MKPKIEDMVNKLEPIDDSVEDEEDEEEVIIDLKKLSQNHEVIRIRVPSHCSIEEVNTPFGKEIVVYKCEEGAGS